MKPIQYTCAVCLLAALTCTVVRGQGSLVPVGGPAPAFKTLQQIEPRIDLGTLPGTASNTVEITGPGSYYLTGNMALDKFNGIQVLSSDVVIDLNGFQLSRVTGGSRGIIIQPDLSNITIKNGAIGGGLFDGIICEDTSGQQSRHIRVENVAIEAIFTALDLGDFASLDHVRISGVTFEVANLGDHSNVRNSEFVNNNASRCVSLGDGSTITDAMFRSNVISGTGRDIIAGRDNLTAERCTIIFCEADDYGIHGFEGMRVEDCTVSQSSLDRAISSGSGNSLIKDCVVEQIVGDDTQSYGIYLNGGVVENCVVSEISHTNASSSVLQGVGISVGYRSIIRNCMVYLTQGDGIRFSPDSTIENNRVTISGFNGDGAAFHGASAGDPGRCRIEGNTAISSDRGFHIENGNNFIVKNLAGLNTVNYEIVASNFVGKIYSPSNSYTIAGGSITGAVGVVGAGSPTAFGSISSDDAWANFNF